MRWVLVAVVSGTLGACTTEVCTCPGADDGGDGGVEADGDAGADLPVDAAADEGDGDAGADLTDEAEADAPPPPPPFSFAVFGDNQFATTSCTSGVSERLAVPAAIVAEAPDFVLHTGDLMDHGYDDGAYEAFEGCYGEMLAALPFFPTMGNHDAGSGGIWNYKAYLERQLLATNPAVWPGDWLADVALWYEDDPNVYSTDFGAPTHRDIVPSGVSFETFYAWRFANAVFLSMEIGTRWWSNTPKTWLQRHLQAAREDPAIDHVFVQLHHPIYSTTMLDDGTGECTGPVRDHYASYFHDHDATIVFSGHAHVYDRFWVPDDGHPTAGAARTTYPRDGDAVHYIVTGGGGGPLPSCSPMPSRDGVVGQDYTQARGCGHHFVLVEVDGPRLAVRAIGVEGSAASWEARTWDRFTIE